MRVVVSTERRFVRTKDGIFSDGAERYAFFQRYLEEFDSVIVVARVSDAEVLPDEGFSAVEGPGVSCRLLETRPGGLHRLLDPAVARQLDEIARLDDAAFMLRVPGLASSLLWLALSARRKPFGLEVVTDPAEAFTKEAFGAHRAGLIKIAALSVLRQQCRQAKCVAYVTARELQMRYPASTSRTFSYSSIDLDPAVYERAPRVRDRLASQPETLDPAALAFVGNLGRPLKGLDILLRAIHRLGPDVPTPRLRIVGEGGLRPEYEEMARDLGISESVEFLGRLPPGDPVYDVLEGTDIFVLPSRREGLPRVVIEAMAVGLPCLCTDVSGARELLEDEDIVPREDPSALARALATMIASRRRRLAAADRNVEAAERYAQPRLRAERNECYRALREATEPSPRAAASGA